jgi:zinc transport system substrate-binding protein
LVAAEMARIDPDNADHYEDNAADLVNALDELDEEYSSALENCERNELVVSHEAFGYLTDRYGLEQVGVSGIDPEADPSPGRVAEVANFAREHGVTTIFFEEQVAPDIAHVIADEIGAGVEVLDPLEFPPDGDSDYFDVMRTNLNSISTALGCS